MAYERLGSDGRGAPVVADHRAILATSIQDERGGARWSRPPAGVSTSRVEKLMQQLSVERMSKSKVSRLATSLDQIVEDSPTRPLDGAAHPYLVLDALEVKCREGAAPLLDEAGSEILAFTGFFEEHWRQRECDG